MIGSSQTGLKRAVLWWMLGGALTVTAGEAEQFRRDGPASLGVCIGSTLLLQGTACPTPSHNGRANPL